MASSEADRLEMFEKITETLGGSVAQTILEEFLSRDRNMVALHDTQRSFETQFEISQARIESRFEAIDRRFEALEITMESRFDAVNSR